MLQNAPMYSYIPAKNVARAREFYEKKLGFKPKEVTPGGVTYEFVSGTACFLYRTLARRRRAKPFGRLRTSKKR
jgi:catechol 2,3-dioxygenase-like lactoylglutathione lyase family enzyme